MLEMTLIRMATLRPILPLMRYKEAGNPRKKGAAKGRREEKHSLFREVIPSEDLQKEKQGNHRAAN